LRPSNDITWVNSNDLQSSGLASEEIDALFLNKALKFPICNLDTILLLEEQCLDNLNKRIQASHEEKKNSKKIKNGRRMSLQSRSRVLISTSTSNGLVEKDTKDDGNDAPPYSTFLPLPPQSVDIPKRLFRNLTSSPAPSMPTPSIDSISNNTTNSTRFESEDLPLLLHILTHLQGNANSNKGYPLAKSVLSRHLLLIEILLEYGADPTVKDYMAVMLAIGRKDLEIVQLLVERRDERLSSNSLSTTSSLPPPSSSLSSSPSSPVGLSGRGLTMRLGNESRSRKRTNPGSNRESPKRRKVEDRFQVTSEMLELAVKLEYEPLIQYFMSKGE